MFKILEQKAKCYKPFRDALLSSGSSILVEATSNEYWGADLNTDQVKVTKPSFFKGTNVLGSDNSFSRMKFWGKDVILSYRYHQR